MDDVRSDDGLTVRGLWAWSWVLGIVAVGSLVRMIVYAAHGVPVHTEFFVWVLLGAVASAFSACGAVLAGIKSVEARLTQHLSSTLDP
jgi:hypothetical protein